MGGRRRSFLSVARNDGGARVLPNVWPGSHRAVLLTPSGDVHPRLGECRLRFLYGAFP